MSRTSTLQRGGFSAEVEAMDPRSDCDALLARYRSSGDPKDLAALFDATAADLYRVAVATAPDAASAEDAVQETFLAVIDAAARWDPARRAMPWLLGILKFKVARLRERARRSAPAAAMAAARGATLAGGTAADASTPSTPAALAASDDADPEAAARAWAEIERLDEPYRAVALLRWRYGLSPQEIAHVRGEAPGTTRSLLSRALARLRRVLLVVPAVLVAGRDARGLDAVRGHLVAVATVRRVSKAARWTLAARIAAAAAVVAIGGGAALYLGRGKDDAPVPPTRGPSDATTTAIADGTGATLAAAPRQPAGLSSPTSVAPKASARGRVVDSEGKPVAGAHVTSLALDAERFVVPAGVPNTSTDAVATTSDAEGRFVIALDESEPTHLLFVASDGFAPSLVGPVRNGAAVDVRLGAGEAWTGEVVDAAGAAIADATVRARVRIPWFVYEVETRSDAHGRYRLDAMLAVQASARARWGATGSVSAQAPGYAPASFPHTLDFPGERAARLVLRRGARASGRVLDGDTGAPIAGATVALRTSSPTMYETLRGIRPIPTPFDRPRAAATTDAEGRWSLDGLAALTPEQDAEMRTRGIQFAGPEVEASAQGFAMTSERLAPAVEGVEIARDLRLFHGATVVGRVLNVDGTPAANVDLRVGAPSSATAWASTNVEGSYRVEGIGTPSGDGVDVTIAVGPRAATTAKLRLRAREETTAADIVLAAPEPSGVPRIPVRVVDEAGHPIWGVELSYANASVRAGVRTDRVGLAQMEAPPKLFERVDAIEVVARAPDFAPAAATRAKDAPASEETRIVLAAPKSLAGRVVDSDGAPASRVTVRARPQAPMTAIAYKNAGSASLTDWLPAVTTTADGRFSMNGLPPGRYTLTATAPSSTGPASARRATLDADAGASEVEIRLPKDDRGPLVRVEVAVVDGSTGEAVKVEYVRLRRGPTDTVWIRPGADGRIASDEVPAGTWDVRVMAKGYALSIKKGVVFVEGEATSRVEVRLAKERLRSGRVVGAPADTEQREIWFTRLDGDEGGGVAAVDAEGRFTVDSLPAGVYRTSWGYPSVHDPGRASKAWVAAGNTVQIEDSDANVDVQLVPAGGLSVRVDDPRLAHANDNDATTDQRKFSGACTLTVLDDRGRVVARPTFGSVMRGNSGAIDRLPLAPGRYRIRLARPGEAPVEVDADVVAGDHTVKTIGR